MSSSTKAWIAGIAALVPALAGAAGPDGSVVVNGTPLAADVVYTLESYYRTPIAPGRYWYDPVSGAWGYEGSPAAGQMAAGLRLGGPLRADASSGNTRVYINGRELSMVEVQSLQQACRVPVQRGRYWVNAQGVGGYEGGPAVFNLANCGGQRAGGSGTNCQNYGNGQFNCSNSNTGIGVIGEGGGKGAVVWGGKVISTPN